MVYTSGGYPPSPRPRSENSRQRLLFVAIVVLGVLTYALSFGPVTDGGMASGWNVRFAALAALCAAFGLLPRREPALLAIAVLASMGFLDGLSTVLSGEGSWPLMTIAVVNAVQAAAAVAALMTSPGESPDSGTAGYDAYVDYYNQAVRNYYSQQAQPAPMEQSSHRGYGQAYADGQATASAPRAQRASQQADYAELDYGGSHASAPNERDPGSAAPARSAGLPSFGQAPTHVDPHRRDTGEAQPPARGF